MVADLLLLGVLLRHHPLRLNDVRRHSLSLGRALALVVFAALVASGAAVRAGALVVLRLEYRVEGLAGLLETGAGLAPPQQANARVRLDLVHH